MFRLFMAVVQPVLASSSQTLLKLRRITATQIIQQTQTLERRDSESRYESKCRNAAEDIARLRQEKNCGEKVVADFLGGCRLTPDFVFDIVKILKNDADSAFFLFKWAGLQELYEHDSRNYSQIIKVLGSGRRFEDLDAVLNEMVGKGCSVEWEVALELVVIYAKAGVIDRAQGILEQLRKQGRAIPAEIYISVLNSLGKLQRHQDVYRMVEELMAEEIIVPDETTADVLIRIYCKSDAVHKAVWVMNRVASQGVQVAPTVFSMLVHSLCKIGKEDTAVSLFEDGFSARELGDKFFICHSLICGVVRTGGLIKASKMIRELVQKGLIFSILEFPFPGAAQPFSIIQVLLLFRKMKVDRSAFEYNSFIEGLCRTGNLEEARQVYDLMRADEVAPDIYTYNYMIECISKAGRVEDALKVLEAMEASDCKPDNFTYTRMLNGFCRSGKLDDALKLYRRMMDSGCSPDAVTFACMISGFSKASKFDEALVILHASIEAGSEADEVSYSTIIDPLCGLELWDSALNVFDLARQRNCPGSIFLYSRLINCLCKSGKMETACLLLQDMCSGDRKSGQLLGGEVCKPSVVIYNTVVSGLCGVGKIDEAYAMVTAMEDEGVMADVVTYTTFLNAFCSGGRLDDACKLLEMMVKSGCAPDVIAYNTVIAALCSASREEEACGLLQVMMENGCEPNAFTYSHLITALCRTKRLEAAVHLFNYMKVANCVPELVTYKELIYGHCRLGNRRQARRLLEQESKAFSMSYPGKSLISELHEAGNAYERRQLSAILSLGCLQE